MLSTDKPCGAHQRGSPLRTHTVSAAEGTRVAATVNAGFPSGGPETRKSIHCQFVRVQQRAHLPTKVRADRSTHFDGTAWLSSRLSSSRGVAPPIQGDSATPSLGCRGPPGDAVGLALTSPAASTKPIPPDMSMTATGAARGSRAGRPSESVWDELEVSSTFKGAPC